MLNKMSISKYISLEVVSASDSNGDSDSDSGGNPGGNSGREAPDPAAYLKEWMLCYNKT